MFNDFDSELQNALRESARLDWEAAEEFRAEEEAESRDFARAEEEEPGFYEDDLPF